MKAVIIGAGAIGGTIGAHMKRAGHDILLCDAAEEHVAAINDHGLHITGPVNDFVVEIDAVTPDALPDRFDRALIAVKSLHTASAAALLPDRLAETGSVLTVQNGLTAGAVVDAVGAERVLSSFVNFGADYLGPGEIVQGNIGTFRVGEITGPITDRVREYADALPYAQPTDNLLGYLWGKEAYGAMMWAGAVSDLSIADSLTDPRFRQLMVDVAAEVLAQAPVTPEPFDGFDPADLPGSLDRLAAFNRASAKSHSGIYRDLMVRRRKTEIDEVAKDFSGPIFARIQELIHDIEEGRRTCEVANLEELAAYAASLKSVSSKEA